jgi:hypothetical protein
MRTLILCAVLAFCFSSARATSVVVWVLPDRILLAADSRISATDKEPLNDKFCKIVVLPDGAFAVNGIAELRHQDDDSIAWSAFALGKEVYAEHKGNVADAANDWADQSVAFWASYLSHQVEEGESLLRNSGIAIVEYDIAGFLRNPDSPAVIIGSVQIDLMAGRPWKPHKVIEVLPPKNEPYSSNPITMELIAGQTDRAKADLAPWLRKFKTIKESDRNWRTLEYLIQQTTKYDPHVNRTVNVLELTANQKPHWLQNLTCR